MNALLIKAVAALAIVLVLTGAAYEKGRSSARQAYETQLSKITAQLATALAEEQTAAREKEQATAQQIAAIEYQHQSEIQHEKSKADAAINDLRAGAVQLRNRFTCPASASGGVPSVATSTSSGDAAAGRGLQGADAELLIREAARADEVVLQLQACQAVIQSDRGSQ